MLYIPCPLKYCLNIYSVDCHSTKKIQFESIKYLPIYKNNLVKAENKPAIHSRCIIARMLCTEKQEQTNKTKPTNPHSPKTTKNQTKKNLKKES